MSRNPGFIPTQKGNQTVTIYVGATVFVYHYSDFTYVHLMYKLDIESIVEANLVIERIFDLYGIRVLHYHSDNGLFDIKNFMESCDTVKQTLIFCGVNFHHQNRNSKNIIKDVTTGARTALLQADHPWTNIIHAYLWPASTNNYANLRKFFSTNCKTQTHHLRNKI